MREIKFRAWDEFNKKMVYDFDVWQPNKKKLPHLPPQQVRVCSHFIIYPFETKLNSYVRVYDERGAGIDYYKGWDYDKRFSEGLIFEQYTGLKDKNGKEIYEGDIVTTIHKTKGKIVWDEYYWVILEEDQNRRSPNRIKEIIGSIHQPEEQKDEPKNPK